MKNQFLCVATSLLILAYSAIHCIAEETWHDNIDEAMTIAKTAGKDLLLLYTGSDWCPPCKKLESEVFGQDEFLNEATNNFVFVKFDFPKKNQLNAATAKQNKTWADKFGVAGYPTVILLDSDLRPYAITGYREGGVENYLGILGEFHQKRIRRDDAFDRAAEATGEVRAKLLDAALSEMEADIAELYYEEIVKEIVEIDKEDGLGLRTKWNASKDSEMRKVIMTDIVVVSRLEKPELAIQFIDEVLKTIKFPAAQRLQISQIKLNLLRALKDVDAMDRLLDEMIGMGELTDKSRQRLIVKKALLMTGTDRADEAKKVLENSINSAREHSSIIWQGLAQLYFAEERLEEAITCCETGIKNANADADILVDLYGTKADCYMALENELRAIQTLDEFAENKQMPVDLRSEALLQKAMIMRDSGRKRRATLVENRAIEISDSPEQRAEVQKLVKRLRKKYGE